MPLVGRFQDRRQEPGGRRIEDFACFFPSEGAVAASWGYLKETGVGEKRKESSKGRRERI